MSRFLLSFTNFTQYSIVDFLNNKYFKNYLNYQTSKFGEKKNEKKNNFSFT